MDQLKPVIEFFKKQYFWVLIGVVTLMSIVSWWMTTSSLSSQLKQNTASLDTKYSSVKEVASKASTHPNNASHEKMDAIAVKLAEDVGKAWELQYNRQVKLMQWPANELGQDFVDRVEKYRPIESLTFPLPSGQDPLGLPLRERYRDYVDPLFPRLAKIIGANWTAATKDLGGGSGGGMTGMGGEGAGPGSGGYGSMMGGLTGGSGGANAALPVASKYLVNWDETAQKQLMQNVLWWHNANKAPSTLEILYTQEDLWILEGLMNIIKATNGDAQENFQAAIKNIEFIRIGKQAVGRAGEISGIASTSSMTGGMNSGMPGMDGGDMEGMPGASSGGSMPDPGAAVGPAGGSSGGAGAEGGEGAATETGPPDPASGRYVDTAFQPIEGEKLRSVVTSGALDPTDAPLAVAKRVPVRMRFIMDQRKVNRLLAECGNADLMLEIRQVRINTAAAAAAAGGMGMGGGMGGLFSGGGMPSASGMGGPSSSSSGGSASADMGESGGMMGMLGGGGAVAGSAKSYDLPVEIWGVVYMFNPVDMNKLGLQNVTAETQLENVGRVDAADSTAPTTDPVAPAEGTQPAAEAPAAGVPAAGVPAAGPPAAEAPGGAVPAAPAGGAPAAAAPGGDPNAPAAPGAPAASSPTGEAPAGGAPAAADGGAGATAPAAGAGSATAPGT
jgi:hypothetical protein